MIKIARTNIISYINLIVVIFQIVDLRYTFVIMNISDFIEVSASISWEDC